MYADRPVEVLPRAERTEVLNEIVGQVGDWWGRMQTASGKMWVTVSVMASCSLVNHICVSVSNRREMYDESRMLGAMLNIGSLLQQSYHLRSWSSKVVMALSQTAAILSLSSTSTDPDAGSGSGALAEHSSITPVFPNDEEYGPTTRRKARNASHLLLLLLHRHLKRDRMMTGEIVVLFKDIRRGYPWYHQR